MAAPVRIALSTDDFTAMGAAVAARSVLDHLHPECRLEVHLLDVGVRPASAARIRASLEDPRCRLTVHRPATEVLVEATQLSGAPFPPAVFGRWLVPDLLPDAERVLYLDCDTLAQHDVAPLYDTSFDGQVACAVVDTEGGGRIGDVARLPWRDEGVAPDSPVINAGVMVMDLEAWRRLDVTGRGLALFRRHPGRFELADQDGVNLVLAGRFRLVHPRWNVHTRFLDGPGIADAERWRRALEDPAIIHYTNRPKPWHRGCRHPFLDRYWDAVDRTAWRGWRPTARHTLPTDVRRALRRTRRVVERISGSAACT